MLFRLGVRHGEHLGRIDGELVDHLKLLLHLLKLLLLLDQEDRVGHLAGLQQGFFHVDDIKHLLEFPSSVALGLHAHRRVITEFVDCKHLEGGLKQIFPLNGLCGWSAEDSLVQLPVLLVRLRD